MKRQGNYSSTVTMKHIAEKTGFSVNTVSHALSNKPDISEKTRKFIMETAREMGYIGNALASSLRSGFSRTIAVIIGDISNPLFGIMVREMEVALGKQDYNMFIMNSNEDPENESKAIMSAISKNVDGLIICPSQKSDDLFDILERDQIPYVLLGRRPNKGEKANHVIWDDFAGGLLATEHLLSLGHRRVLCLSGPSYISSAKERTEGYRAAHEKMNIPVCEELVHEIPLVNHSLDKVIKEAMKVPGGFSAVFAFSDMLAWETISVLETLGKKVPQDISVVAFDDIQSKLPFPCALTTIHTPKTIMATTVVDILMKKISSRSTRTKQTVIPVNLIVRNTTSKKEP